MSYHIITKIIRYSVLVLFSMIFGSAYSADQFMVDCIQSARANDPSTPNWYINGYCECAKTELNRLGQSQIEQIPLICKGQMKLVLQKKANMCVAKYGDNKSVVKECIDKDSY